MSTLLILGSKPEPVLPTPDRYDAIACANASGFMAARLGLAVPCFTVMSAILTGSASGSQSLKALHGLRTETLYFMPMVFNRRNPLKRALELVRNLDMTEPCFKWKLQASAYHYDRFVSLPRYQYLHWVIEQCDNDPDIVAMVKRKRPSTGIVALLIGCSQPHYDRFILSGFSFELTHAYADNPEIVQRGGTASRHGDTDIAVIRHLAQKYRNIYTTEAVVNARAGIPLLG
jgi:hypothetical protein